MIHALKIQQEYLEEIESGRKTFEVRENDRGYMVGDYLALHGIENKTPTGHFCLVRVEYILDSLECCKPGMVIMTVKRCAIACEADDFERNQFDKRGFDMVDSRAGSPGEE